MFLIIITAYRQSFKQQEEGWRRTRMVAILDTSIIGAVVIGRSFTMLLGGGRLLWCVARGIMQPAGRALLLLIN